jgi:hypothetical protein
MPPRNAADFLELAENGVFWIGYLLIASMRPGTGDGHEEGDKRRLARNR